MGGPRFTIPAAVLAATTLACPGPEPHLRALAGEGAGGSGAGGAGGAGGSGADGGGGRGGGSGGSGGCGNGMVEPKEICFKPIQELPTPSLTQPLLGAVQDMNDDGMLDLSGIASGTVYTFKAESPGAFALASTTEGYAFRRPGIFTPDALPDEVLFPAGGAPYFRRNQGDFTFDAPESIGTYPVQRLAAGDIDGDATDDLVVLFGAPGTDWPVYIANGTDHPFDSGATTTIKGDPCVVAGFALMNADPQLDFVTLHTAGDRIHVYLNQNGTLPTLFVSSAIVPPGQMLNGFAAADIDRMPGSEIAITHGGGSSSVALMKVEEAGGVAALEELPVGGTQFAPDFADIDHDGILDLVVGVAPDGGGAYEIVVLPGTGGSVAPFFDTVVHPEHAKDPRIDRQMIVADLDEDGAMDIVIRSNDTTGILLLMSNP
jgi:hypothetical protein